MTATDGVSFGALLRRSRRAAGLTQAGLAERAGISAKAISDLERDAGRNGRIPRLDTVVRLAEALGLDATCRAALLASARPDDHPAAPFALPSASADTMPRPLTPLLGRAGITSAVAEHLLRGDTRFVTLTGPGGVGKTRVAIAVAERVTGAFAHGTLFVDLAPLRDPELVLPTIAQQLALDERGSVSIRERLIALLRPRHLLLFLDNFEHLVEARDEIQALLETCPHLVVLATSRIPLRLRGEREYRVAPLELPDELSGEEDVARTPSAALFLDRAGAVGTDLTLDAGTTAAVAGICRRLDGLPLAIELAAGWTRLLSPTALLARLDQRLPLLVGGAHDLPSRQRTMRDTIAWSYDLLAPREQRLFRRLCVFVGGCTLDAAVVVGGEPDLAVVSSLIEKNVIWRREFVGGGETEPRLGLLETLREYGLERLAAADELESLHQSHAAYFMAFAEEATAHPAAHAGSARHERLERDHDNLRAVLRWSIDRGERVFALRLTGALWRFWSERGHLSEGRQWLRAALTLPVRSGDDEDAGLRLTALVGATHLAINQGIYDEADLWCGEAIALARTLGVHEDLIESLNALGLIERERARYPEAASAHDEALTLARTHGDRRGMAAALAGLAYAATYSGDLARGVELADQGLSLYRALEDLRGQGMTLLSIATSALHVGDYARSEQFGAEALTLFRTLGDTGRMSEALWVLSVGTSFQGRFDEAASLVAETLALRQGRGDERGSVEPLSAQAFFALVHGDLPRARALLEETLEILQRYDDPWSRAMSLALLGHVELAAGRQDRAAPLFHESVAMFLDIGNPLFLPWPLEGLAALAAEQGEWEQVAMLSGARDQIFAQLDVALPPVNELVYTEAVAASQEALGGVEFQAAHRAGAATRIEQILANGTEIVGETAMR